MCELLSQALVDLARNHVRPYALSDLLRERDESAVEHRTVAFGTSRERRDRLHGAAEQDFEPFSFSAHALGHVAHEERQKLHCAQNAQHLVVFRQGAAMVQLAVVRRTDFGRQILRDAVHNVDVVFRSTHGSSNSLTRSNSANMRRR